MLHKGLSVHHRDLKPNNIGFVLDHTSHTLQWKVFDFSGMKRDLLQAGTTTAFAGPWCAPEKWSTGRKRARSPLSAPRFRSAPCSSLSPLLSCLVCCGRPCSLLPAPRCVAAPNCTAAHCCDFGSVVVCVVCACVQ